MFFEELGRKKSLKEANDFDKLFKNIRPHQVQQAHLEHVDLRKVKKSNDSTKLIEFGRPTGCALPLKYWVPSSAFQSEINIGSESLL